MKAEWWIELDDWLNDTHSWSISAVTSTAWVVIAYDFTVVDSLTTDLGSSIQANGQGVGTLWLRLLPNIIGWLMSPKCNSVRLSGMIERANRSAYVATDDGSVMLARYAGTGERAVELTILEVDLLTRDGRCTTPIYNYARFLPWVMAVEEVCEAFHGASDHHHDHLSADPTIHWVGTSNLTRVIVLAISIN